MHYKIHGITDEIDRAARALAKLDGLSLDAVLLRALRIGLGVDPPIKRRDFLAIFQGEPLEPEVLKCLEEQRQIDPEVWE